MDEYSITDLSRLYEEYGEKRTKRLVGLFLVFYQACAGYTMPPMN